MFALSSSSLRVQSDTCACHQVWLGDHDYAGIDMFPPRQDGKLVEHCDVLPVIPDASTNQNGMFKQGRRLVHAAVCRAGC